MVTRKNTHLKTIFNIRCDLLIILFLVIVTFSVYWQVRNHEFLIWDDNLYVTENRHVKSGLTLENMAWTFSARHAGNWHPLTWLSHMLDVQLYGMNPGAHHLTNLLFHIFNTVLLFLVFNRLTGRLWQSGFIAVLFAIHPLHVESVVWVSERKDVLSTFFWFLTMWSYIWYVESQSIKRYLLVVFCFILGLMSKPMLVTLPFVLFLLDFWPLNRLKVENNRFSIKGINASILWEKIPLLILAIASGLVTFIVQQDSGAVGTLYVYPLIARISNALVSYVSYVGKMFWPFKLAFFYPYPLLFPWEKVAAACLILITISFLAIKTAKQKPWLIVGWLWYVGTLVPVIGFIQVGLQGMADRYSYVPLIGLFIIIAWGVPELLGKMPYKRAGVFLLTPALFSILFLLTRVQIGYWKTDIALTTHAIEVTESNYVAHNNLGLALAIQGRKEDAIRHYTEALKIQPKFVFTHNNLGAVLAEQGRLPEAADAYEEALRLKPDFAGTHNNLALVLAAQDKTEDAIRHYEEAIKIKPDFVEAHNNLGVLLSERGRIEEASFHYAEALRIDPLCTGAHNNLAKYLEAKGKTAKAIYHYVEAIRIEPDFVEAHYNLGIVLAKQGRLKEAENSFLAVLRIDPDNTIAHYNLDKIVQEQDEINASIKEIVEELEINPEKPLLYYKLGTLYKRKGEIETAIAQYQKALSFQPAFVRALNSLAIALAIKGEYEKGISLLEKSITNRPDDAEAYYYLASIYARQNKVEKSIKWLSQAIQRGFDNWNLLKTDKNLENIRGTLYYKEVLKDN